MSKIILIELSTFKKNRAIETDSIPKYARCIGSVDGQLVYYKNGVPEPRDRVKRPYLVAMSVLARYMHQHGIEQEKYSKPESRKRKRKSGSGKCAFGATQKRLF